MLEILTVMPQLIKQRPGKSYSESDFEVDGVKENNAFVLYLPWHHKERFPFDEKFHSEFPAISSI